MKLLAIETATEACSAALLLDGTVTERYAVEPRRHSELILAMLDVLLADAGLRLNQLDAIAFGRGPGAFTGVRIAVSVAQGIAFGADLPVVPVSTLAALAQGHHRRSGARRILPAYDARMGELYWAGYEISETGLAELCIEEQVATAETVTLPPGDGWHGVGTGWASYGETLRGRLGERLAYVDGSLLCHAHDVALLGAAGYAAGLAVSAEQALPVYLRDRVAQKPRAAGV